MRDSAFKKELKDHNRKIKKYYIVGIIFLAILGVVGSLFYRNSSGFITKQKLEVANEYMIDKEYEQAILAYEEVLDIRPENVEASLGIVESYISTENYQKALIYAKKGYENTKNKEIKVELEILDSGMFVYTTMDKSKKIYYLPDGILHGIDEYDANENLVHSFDYDEEKNIIANQNYEYDDKGNKIKSFFYFLDDTQNYYAINEFDDQGNLIKNSFYKMKGSLFTSHEFDENGEVNKYYVYKEDETLDYYVLAQYDEDRNTFVQSFYTATGLLDYIIEHDDLGNGIRMDYNSEGILEILKEYGNKGLVDKEYYYNEDETINCYVVYEYNDAENLIHETSYDMDDIVNFEYEYDENENVSKAFTYGVFGSLNYYYVYEYDVQGNMIEEFVFNSNGTIKYKWGYEYDEHGNAIKKLYYSGNGKLNYYEIIKYDERGNQINWVRYNADGTDWSL